MNATPVVVDLAKSTFQCVSREAGCDSKAPDTWIKPRREAAPA